jgi:hypothetical protein
LKDGRVFRQVVIDSGYLTKVREYQDIPFTGGDIDHFVVAHDTWKD